jgi:hypothetical protein
MIKRYLTINSIDRKDGSPSNFNINIKDGIKYNTCKLIMCQIPNTYYNITNNNNGILINGTLKNITPGNYNLDEFFNEFSNNLDPVIVSIGYNDSQGILTFTTSSSVNISFPSFGSLHSVLGFPNIYNTTSNSFSSSYPPSLAKHILFIDIDTLSNNHSTSYEYSSSNTFSVANNVNKNEIIFFNEKTNFKQSINCRHPSEVIHNISIKIRDQYNQIVSGLGEWTLILSFY